VDESGRLICGDVYLEYELELTGPVGTDEGVSAYSSEKSGDPLDDADPTDRRHSLYSAVDRGAYIWSALHSFADETATVSAGPPLLRSHQEALARCKMLLGDEFQIGKGCLKQGCFHRDAWARGVHYSAKASTRDTALRLVCEDILRDFSNIPLEFTDRILRPASPQDDDIVVVPRDKGPVPSRPPPKPKDLSWRTALFGNFSHELDKLACLLPAGSSVRNLAVSLAHSDPVPHEVVDRTRSLLLKFSTLNASDSLPSSFKVAFIDLVAENRKALRLTPIEANNLALGVLNPWGSDL
jgi:hypothetical protein